MKYALEAQDGRVHTLKVTDEAEYEADCGETFDPLDGDFDVELVLNEEQFSKSACPSCSWDSTPEAETTEE